MPDEEQMELADRSKDGGKIEETEKNEILADRSEQASRSYQENIRASSDIKSVVSEIEEATGLSSTLQTAQDARIRPPSLILPAATPEGRLAALETGMDEIREKIEKSSSQAMLRANLACFFSAFGILSGLGTGGNFIYTVLKNQASSQSAQSEGQTVDVKTIVKNWNSLSDYDFWTAIANYVKKTIRRRPSPLQSRCYL